MIKYYCDICLKEITGKNYTKEPIRYRLNDNEATLQVGTHGRVGEGDICETCAVRIVVEGTDVSLIGG